MAQDDTNLDSFVDIVTNTAGILVVLVVLSVLRAQEVGVQYNPKLKELVALDKKIGTRRQKLASFTKDLARAKAAAGEAQSALASSLSRLATRHPDIARFRDARARAAELARAEKQNGERAVALAQLTAERWELLAAAQRTTEAAGDDLAKLGPGRRALVLDTPLEKLREDLEKKRAEADDATLEAVGLKATRDRLLNLVWRASHVLAVAKAQQMDIRDYRPRAALSRRHFAECYLPKRALDRDGEIRPAVRFVDPSRFAREGATLSPSADGESVFRILDPNSAYRSFLDSRDAAYRADHHVHFVVRPDAYAAFRVARKLARESGWHVEWTPGE